MIHEPQLSYVLELLQGLGPAADDFVLAGAQAMRFMLATARPTRDFDFVLDVVSLRELDMSVAERLRELGYEPVPGSRNFQFQKAIPNSREVMRIEFMGPEQYKREKDFRVDVQQGVHARACTGGSIVLAESDYHELTGHLPDGTPARARVRVIRPHALVMMKCLAMDDRHRNIRGPEQYEHDRDEARIHAGDIIAILSVQDMEAFRERFLKQFELDPSVGERTLQIVEDYFGDETKPGVLLYEELLRERAEDEQSRSGDVAAELRRAQRLAISLLGK